jgi:hypothetical protein
LQGSALAFAAARGTLQLRRWVAARILLAPGVITRSLAAGGVIARTQTASSEIDRTRGAPSELPAEETGLLDE